MSQKAPTGVDIIVSMPRKEFHQKYVRGICRTLSFGALVSFHAKNLSMEEKMEVRRDLANNDIPFEMTKTDDVLDEIAAVVSARAVSLE